MERRLPHNTSGHHQKLTSLFLPALLPSLLPTCVHHSLFRLYVIRLVWYLRKKKEPCNVTTFKTLLLCLLAVTFLYKRLLVVIYIELWLSPEELILHRHVPQCECRLWSCLPSVRSQAADFSDARRGETTSTSSSPVCDLSFYPTSLDMHVALYLTTQLWPSKDMFLMSPRASCFEIFLSPVKLWAHITIKNKIPPLMRK